MNGAILWANLHLLFWLSLVPFTTAWMGENHFAAVPAAAYGIVLLAAALAYYGLQTAIIRDQGPGSVLAARGRPGPSRGSCRRWCTSPASRCRSSTAGWRSRSMPGAR